MDMTASALKHLGFQRFARPADISRASMRRCRMTFNQCSGGGSYKDGREFSLDWTAAIDDRGDLWALENHAIQWTVKDLNIELVVYGFTEDVLLFLPTDEMIERLATFHR